MFSLHGFVLGKRLNIPFISLVSCFPMTEEDIDRDLDNFIKTRTETICKMNEFETRYDVKLNKIEKIGVPFFLDLMDCDARISFSPPECPFINNIKITKCGPMKRTNKLDVNFNFENYRIRKLFIYL